LLSFLDRWISTFPENLIICLLVLSIAFYLESIFFPIEITILTFYTSLMTLIFIVNYLLGTSTDPSIITNYIFLEEIERGPPTIFLDYTLVGLGLGSVWLIFLILIRDFFKRARKMSIRQVFGEFRINLSRVVGFFDAHPWFVTILIGTITLLVGILIGTWKG